MKRCTAILLALALLVLTACAVGQAPSPEPESGPSPVSEAAPELSSSEGSSVPGYSSAPEEPSQPESIPAPEPDHAGDPDQGPQENPDTSLVPETEEQKANHQRAANLHAEIREAFPTGLAKESFSYYTCYSDGGPVILEIGVMNEAAVDAYLSTWTGTKWDTLLKVPGSVSQAGQEEFARKAEKLDLGPDVSFSVTPYDGLYAGEYGKIFVSAFVNSREDRENLSQTINAFANEMGVPEDMLAYRIEVRSSSADPNANPDT